MYWMPCLCLQPWINIYDIIMDYRWQQLVNELNQIYVNLWKIHTNRDVFEKTYVGMPFDSTHIFRINSNGLGVSQTLLNLFGFVDAKQQRPGRFSSIVSFEEDDAIDVVREDLLNIQDFQENEMIEPIQACLNECRQQLSKLYFVFVPPNFRLANKQTIWVTNQLGGSTPWKQLLVKHGRDMTVQIRRQKFMAWKNSEYLCLLFRHWFGDKFQVRAKTENSMWDFDESIWDDVLQLFPELRFEAPVEMQSVVRATLCTYMVPDLAGICMQYLFT